MLRADPTRDIDYSVWCQVDFFDSVEIRCEALLLLTEVHISPGSRYLGGTEAENIEIV